MKPTDTLADARKPSEQMRSFIYSSDILAGFPDHRPDGSGLDDGPYLPGRAPRRNPPKKSPEELAAIRAKAWATRRGERDNTTPETRNA